jgi:hypothetical protein
MLHSSNADDPRSPARSPALQPEAGGSGDKHSHGRRCADFGRSDVFLEVHHVNGDPTDNRIANTIPLCRDWHRSPTFPGA